MPEQDVMVAETVAMTMPARHIPQFSYPPSLCSNNGGGGGGGGATTTARKKMLTRAECCGTGLKIAEWLESMRAASPTHARAGDAACFRIREEEIYERTGRRRPSAFDALIHDIIERSYGKEIVMFLDYDGTLSPIVDDPDRAFMSEAMREAVRDVAKFFSTAIVSGRSRDKVFEFVGLSELYYAGSHGLDIKGPAKRTPNTKANKAKALLYQPASHFVPMIDEVYKLLVDRVKSIPGAQVENNKFCVSVHFRRVEEKRWSSLAEQVSLVVKEYPRLRVSQGRKVLEIRPTIKWDKGKALGFLLESLGFADFDSVMPIYIGDDQTDEDAFKVLKKTGFGILVSEFPKETSASCSLRDPDEVMIFLRRLVEWKMKTYTSYFPTSLTK